MAELVPVTDHEEQAYGLLIEQYSEKPRIAALLASHTVEVQEAEDAANASLVGMRLDDAEGAQLDVIGRIVELAREGRADNVYRVLLAGKIRVNWSHGHARDIVQVVRIVQGDANSHRYRDVYPASLEVIFQNDFVETDRGFVAPELEQLIAGLVRDARAAGIHSAVLAVNEGGTPLALEYDDDVPVTGDEGLSYDDDVQDGGGLPAGIYS